MTQDDSLPPEPPGATPVPDPDPGFCVDDETQPESEPQVETKPDPQPAQVPAAFTLERDTPCRRCGYNLRGLNSAGLCPECGTPVAMSLQSDLFRYADPAYIRTLASGARAIVWGEILTIAANSYCGPCATNGSVHFLFITEIVVLVGIWQLTTPDPSNNDFRRGRCAPTFALTTQIAVLLLALPIVFTGRASVWFDWLTPFSLIAWGAARIALLYRVEQLGVRIPDYALVVECRYLRVTFAATSGLLLALLIGTLASTAPRGTLGNLMMLASGILWLIAGIWFITLIWRLGTLLWKEAIRSMLEAPSRTAQR